MNQPKNIDFDEQLSDHVEETAEMNQMEKQLTKNRLINCLDNALDLDKYDKFPFSFH